jgi:hypothetical protein
MAEWIEVPAHRIYVICARELRDGFDYIDEKGKPVKGAEISYRFVRKKDGKVFKWARSFRNIPKFITVRRSKRYDFKELGDHRSGAVEPFVFRKPCTNGIREARASKTVTVPRGTS